MLTMPGELLSGLFDAPALIPSETVKVAFKINHLMGRAGICGTAEWEKQTTACHSFDTFSQELKHGEGGKEGVSPPACSTQADRANPRRHMGEAREERWPRGSLLWNDSTGWITSSACTPEGKDTLPIAVRETPTLTP